MRSDDIVILKGSAVYKKDTYTLSKNPEENSDWLKKKKNVFLSDVHKYFLSQNSIFTIQRVSNNFSVLILDAVSRVLISTHYEPS